MTHYLQMVVASWGATGCAIFPALAQAGPSFCTLFERTALTAGSTWHTRSPRSLVGVLSCSDLVDRRTSDTVSNHQDMSVFLGHDRSGFGRRPHGGAVGDLAYELGLA